MIVNNASKIESTLSPMEQWSILSNVINYVQYSKNPKNFHAMKIKPINNRKISRGTKNRNIDKSLLRVNLVCTSDRSMEEYLDRYKGVKSEILNTTRFDENSDLSTTYLGRSNMTQGDNLAIEEMFQITEQGYIVGKLLNSTECQILLDTRASKSLCLNPSIYIVNHLTHYQSLLLKHKVFR